MSVGKNRIIWPIPAISVLIMILVLTAVLLPTTEAGTGPKVVRGYVYDINGDPIVNANVTINMKDGVTTRKTLWYDSSEPDGYYSVTFDPAYWDIGNTIEVIGTFGIDSGTNSTAADASPVQTVDVTISIVIPEFGLFGTYSIAIMSTLMIAMVLIARKRKLD